MIVCLLDTGPLVGILDSSEPDHESVRGFLARAQQLRFITSGAVVTEAFYFLADVKDGPARLVSFLQAGAIEIRDVFAAHPLDAAVRLMSKYADIPMDFPDATLVGLAEQTGTANVLTLDRRGFATFRYGRNRRFNLLLDEP